MWRWKVQDLILKFWDLYRCTVGFEGCWTWRREASFTSWRCILVYTIEMLECASSGSLETGIWYIDIYTHIYVYIVCWSHAMDRWRGWSDGWMAGCVDPEHGIILAHVGWNGARKKIQKIQWGLRRLNLYVQTQHTDYVVCILTISFMDSSTKTSKVLWFSHGTWVKVWPTFWKPDLTKQATNPPTNPPT